MLKGQINTFFSQAFFTWIHVLLIQGIATAFVCKLLFMWWQGHRYFLDSLMPRAGGTWCATFVCQSIWDMVKITCQMCCETVRKPPTKPLQNIGQYAGTFLLYIHCAFTMAIFGIWKGLQFNWIITNYIMRLSVKKYVQLLNTKHNIYACPSSSLHSCCDCPYLVSQFLRFSAIIFENFDWGRE